MKEIYGNLFNQNCDAICITTNGFVKKDGCLVMGRGCAKQAMRMFPSLPKMLGRLVADGGNRPIVVDIQGHPFRFLCTFPVKPAYRNGIPGWGVPAEIPLIVSSACELMEIATRREFESIVIPRPGCGNGELNWKDVQKVIAPILDDRFSIITF